MEWEYPSTSTPTGRTPSKRVRTPSKRVNAERAETRELKLAHASNRTDFLLMSSVTIKGRPVPIAYDGGNTEQLQKALDTTMFKDWKASVNANKSLNVKKIEVQGIDMFGPTKVGFLKFKADVEVDGRFVPGIVFMRGGAVAILVILSCAGKEYAVLTKQPRVPVGDDAYPEIPAGMLDGDGAFGGVAAKEMKEETGIEILEKDLVDMTDLAYGPRFKGMIPSAGGCDEFLRLFVYKREVAKNELDALIGKTGLGVREEGEVITLDVKPLSELWKCTSDGKTLASLCLYDKLVSEGKIEGASTPSKSPAVSIWMAGCVAVAAAVAGAFVASMKPTAN